MEDNGFVNHYEVLQISPNAQGETIQRVYRLLAQLYHPDNKDTGDPEMFEQVLTAYRILSDPERRAAYDVEYGLSNSRRWKIFDQASAVQGLESEKRKRVGILALLCAKRINEPHSPHVTLVELEQLLGCPREHLEFSLWYLRETGRVQRGDSGRYLVTAKGVEMLEDHSEELPASELRMLNSPRPASK